ncbi:PAR-1a protein [Striga asiatica]|uniref:PAR-1a protein n=1 Tax=Striga asiatica TaxID=4170 RepID=A0A5A7QNT4_STRAF|nr:PAR-1a protein [Striga asiatica]
MLLPFGPHYTSLHLTKAKDTPKNKEITKKMAPTTLLVIALALVFSIQGSLCEIQCENLSEDSCAFAVSSKGNRCVLESRSFARRMGTLGGEYTCRTSEIKASNMFTNYIESKECIAACGVDKRALGISSDSLLDRSFIDSFCSASCYEKCHNIVDLYFNLAAGEGVFLPMVCERHHSGARRGMMEKAYSPSSESFEVALNDVLESSTVPAPSPAY